MLYYRRINQDDITDINFRICAYTQLKFKYSLSLFYNIPNIGVYARDMRAWSTTVKDGPTDQE